MGTVRYHNGNNHIELRGDIEDYVVNSMTAGALVLEYDDSVDPLPDRWPDKVEFIVENGVLQSWTLDLATARQLGLQSTANASRHLAWYSPSLVPSER